MTAGDLYILGASGHAFDIADVAATCGYRVIFVTHRQDEIEGWHHHDPIVEEATALAHERACFAIGIGDNRARAGLAKRIGEGRRFPSLIHPDTSFGRGTRAAVEAARGSVVMAGARFTGGIVVGDFVTINLGATVSHDVELGNYVNLSPGAHIAGNVRVGEGAWLGIGVAVNQGRPDAKLSIGAWTTIGSGAVVTRDCDANSLYVGVPARKMP